MKTVSRIVILAAMFCLAATAGSQTTSGDAKLGNGKVTPTAPKDVYLGLRNKMLQGSRRGFGLPAGSGPNDPWGVLMDWGVEKGTVSVVAASDGSASVCFSSGGGFIGGKGQEPIRKAAQRVVEIARAMQLPARAAAPYPLPQRGGVTFYLLTDSGPFVASTTESELNSTTHPLRQLGDAMQEVITQYRLWSDQQKKAKSQ